MPPRGVGTLSQTSMPYTKKARKFFGMCSNPKSRKKAKKKCPPARTAKKLLRHGKK